MKFLSPSKANEPRPIFVSVLGWAFLVLGSLNFISSVYSVFSPDFSLLRKIYILALSPVGMIVGYGILRMEKWAVYFWLATYVFGWLVFFVYPPTGFDALNANNEIMLFSMVALPTIVLFIVGRHWKKFS